MSIDYRDWTWSYRITCTACPDRGQFAMGWGYLTSTHAAMNVRETVRWHRKEDHR